MLEYVEIVCCIVIGVINGGAGATPATAVVCSIAFVHDCKMTVRLQ